MLNKRNIWNLLTGLLLVVCSCDHQYQDYLYIVSNDIDTSIVVQYKVFEDTLKTHILEAGEELTLANRMDVPGKDVWDIETSNNLYKVQSLIVYSADSLRKTEELAYRKNWSGPIKNESNGEYRISINDSILALKKQPGYLYKLHSDLHDTLIVTYYLVGHQRTSDTLIGKGDIELGTATIYTFGEEHNDLPKYKTQKLTGLHSIALRKNSLGQSQYRNINLQKDTMYFHTSKDSCVFNITDILF